MAGNAGKIRAGRAYVELGVDDRLTAGLNRAQAKLKAFAATVGKIGRSMQSVGREMVLLGAIATAPFVLATKSLVGFQDALARIKGVVNPTVDGLQDIEDSIKNLSKTSGIGPTEIAVLFTELLKAGLTAEEAMDGAAKSALEFSKIGKLEVKDAATTMSDAMRIFAREGLTAAQTVDILTSAADASSIDIHQMTLSFAQASAAAGLAHQNLETLSTAIAILGSAGIKGSDAGTSLRTAFLRLAGAVAGSREDLERMGIRTRDATGEMLSFRDIIVEMQRVIGGMNKAAQAEALGDLFGQDAIRSGQIFLDRGAKGWDEMTQKMREQLPVSTKFAVLMDTIGGSLQRLRSAMERLGIAVGEALGASLNVVLENLINIIDRTTEWVKENKALVVGLATAAVGITAAGVALIGIGLSLRITGAAILGFTGILKTALIGGLFSVKAAVIVARVALAMLPAPMKTVALALAALGAYFLYTSGTADKAVSYIQDVLGKLRKIADDTFAGIADAIMGGDMLLAAKILWLGLKSAWLEGIDPLREAWAKFMSQYVQVAGAAFYGILDLWESVSNTLEKAWIEVTSAFEKVWASTTAFLGSLWDGFIGGLLDVWYYAERVLRKGWNALKGVWDETFDVDAANQQVDVDIDARKQRRVTEETNRAAEREKQRQKAIDDAEKKRQARREAQEKEHQDAMKRITDAEIALSAAASKNATDDIAKAAAELEAAKKALEQARAKAKEEREQSEKEREEEKRTPPKQETPPEFPAGEGGLLGGSKGGSQQQFSGLNAELTLGGPMEDAAKRTAKNTADTVRAIESLGDDAGSTGLAAGIAPAYVRADNERKRAMGPQFSTPEQRSESAAAYEAGRQGRADRTTRSPDGAVTFQNQSMFGERFDGMISRLSDIIPSSLDAAVKKLGGAAKSGTSVGVSTDKMEALQRESNRLLKSIETTARFGGAVFS